MDPLTPADSGPFQEERAIQDAALTERKRRQAADVHELSFDLERFLFRLGRRPVYLTWTEFRIVSVLASKPYRPFSPAQIVREVANSIVSRPANIIAETSPLSAEAELTEDNLGEHIRTLRDKLGLFSDYIQSVPKMGYRFKP